MKFETERTNEEVDLLYERAMKEESGRYAGMTYAEGIVAAIDFLQDKCLQLDEIMEEPS